MARLVVSAVASVERDLTTGASSRTGRAKPHLILMGILVIAAVVRLWGLGSQPVLYFDSGVYLGEGAFLASAAERASAALFAPGVANPLVRVAQATETGTDGHPPDIAKPGHAILLAMAFLLLGKTVLAGGLVSALSGIGAVAGTYAVGMRGWGPRVALPAAALLAVSGQSLVYSREPLVEADGMLFALLASLVYLRSRGMRGLFGAGLLWGVAFSCNNRLSYVPAVFVIAELAAWPGWRGFIQRGLAVAIGFVVPLTLIEGGYLVALGVGRLTSMPTNWLDYAHQLVAFTRMNPPDRFRPDEWPTYFADVALMDGLPVLALLLIGIGFLAWRLSQKSHTRAELLLAGSLLVPLALYSVYSTGEVRLRHFSLALPWVMLAAGLGLSWVAGQLVALTRLWSWDDMAMAANGSSRHRRNAQENTALAASSGHVGAWLLAGLSGLLMLAAVPRVAALDSAPSGMPAVLNAIGSAPVASTNGPVMSFYVGEDRTNARLRAAFIDVPSDLVPLSEQYPTLVVDMQAAVFAGDVTDVYAHATPRLVVANGSDAWYLADLLEHFGMPWGTWNDLLARWDANRGIATELRVYDMADVIAALQGDAPTQGEASQTQ